MYRCPIYMCTLFSRKKKIFFFSNLRNFINPLNAGQKCKRILLDKNRLMNSKMRYNVIVIVFLCVFFIYFLNNYIDLRCYFLKIRIMVWIQNWTILQLCIKKATIWDKTGHSAPKSAKSEIWGSFKKVLINGCLKFFEWSGTCGVKKKFNNCWF